MLHSFEKKRTYKTCLNLHVYHICILYMYETHLKHMLIQTHVKYVFNTCITHVELNTYYTHVDIFPV